MGSVGDTLAVGKAVMVVLASFGVSAIATWLGVVLALWRFRRWDGKPWAERAAASYPARVVCARLGLANALAIGGVVVLRIAPGLELRPLPLAPLSILAALTGSMAIAQRLGHRLRQAAAPVDGPARRGIVLAWVLQFPGLAILFLLLAFIPQRWGWPAALVLAIGSLLLAGHLLGLSLLVLSWLGLLRRASPRLQQIVDRTADRVGIHPRATYELTSPNANAIAWFLPRLLVYTSPICEVLGDDELAAVTAHELGHLAEPRAVFLMRIYVPFLVVAVAAGIPLAGSYGPLAGLAPVVLLLAAVVVVRRVGRRMEERADRLALTLEGDSAVVYARALEKIYEANLIPVVLRSKRQIHPDLYDRLVAAGVPPAYPRPAPPPRVLLAALPSLLLVTVCAWQAFSAPIFYETAMCDDQDQAAQMARAADSEVDPTAAVRLLQRAAASGSTGSRPARDRPQAGQETKVNVPDTTP